MTSAAWPTAIRTELGHDDAEALFALIKKAASSGELARKFG